MKKTIKIYSREYTNEKTKQNFTVNKLIALNDRKDKVLYGDIKWYIKRELVNELLGENMGGIFDADITKIVKKEYKGADGKTHINLVFEISSLEPSMNLDFDNELTKQLSKINDETIKSIFE